MPTPSAYPTPSQGGPRFTRCQIVSIKYPTVLGPPYADGGRDSFLASTTPSEVLWEIEHGQLLLFEASILDAHNAEAYDTHYSFNFIDPETGTLWTGVRYQEYQRGSRTNRNINKRLTRLVWRP